jgi:hypothetical protein
MNIVMTKLTDIKYVKLYMKCVDNIQYYICFFLLNYALFFSFIVVVGWGTFWHLQRFLNVSNISYLN